MIMLQGFVTEDTPPLKASARLGVGRRHHNTIRSLRRMGEQLDPERMRLNKADGKRKSTSSPCHLGSHSTWYTLGPLLPYASACTGAI